MTGWGTNLSFLALALSKCSLPLRLPPRNFILKTLYAVGAVRMVLAHDTAHEDRVFLFLFSLVRRALGWSNCVLSVLPELDCETRIEPGVGQKSATDRINKWLYDMRSAAEPKKKNKIRTGWTLRQPR